jgi:hypothetical protein
VPTTVTVQSILGYYTVLPGKVRWPFGAFLLLTGWLLASLILRPWRLIKVLRKCLWNSTGLHELH